MQRKKSEFVDKETLEKSQWVVTLLLYAIASTMIAWSVASWGTGFFYVAHDLIGMFQLITAFIIGVAMTIIVAKKALPKLKGRSSKVVGFSIIGLAFVIITMANTGSRWTELFIIFGYKNITDKFLQILGVSFCITYLALYFAFSGLKWPWTKKSEEEQYVEEQIAMPETIQQ